MHSLFLRIFVLFWIAMALIVGGSIAVTFTVAAHEYESRELQRRPAAIAIQASEVLGKGGVAALKKWLSANEHSIADRDLYIIGPDGQDILGRRLSDSAARRLEYFNRESMNEPDSEASSSLPPPPLPPPRNFRPQRAAPQIVGPDGSTYTVLLVPRRPSIFGALSLPGISLMILCIALVVSAFASWWLAQHLSAPIRRIQEGARALASENLDARGGASLRVSAGFEDRKDELAVLARDFDAMADGLIANRAAVTRLLRDISHELRSPLARMRLAVGLARRPTADSGRQLDRLEREIERLDDLISQVLKLARLNGTDAPIEREPVDVDEMIEEIVHDANFEGAAKGCRISVEGSAGRTVNGNRELLRSAIENVLRNAVRYSPPGAPVEVAVERGDGGLAVSIRDRGPGVPAADLERIFEPFFRVAESRDRDSGGEGIGLAITSQVMRAHGGSATAGNRPAGGLEVRLGLPPAAWSMSGGTG
ncbi:MAG TPA: ATP-binding protein [Steroidobacteraceae bacterium]|jgi:two-component system OmpR family sensor kinase|nr:ATP-binding protein [Steroidobacteraceae bacterium]